jgi:hypothetical protein
MQGDKPFRVFFPEPIVLHGADEKRMIEVAIEYLRQSGKVRVEPLFAPEQKGSESQ